MQVYWVTSSSQVIPAVLKRRGRTSTWIAVLNQEKDQVEYRHIEKRFLQTRHLYDAIDEREAAAMQQRAARTLFLGHS